MSEQLVLTEQKGAVFEIALNRPDKMNALTDAMYALLNEALDSASTNNEIKVVVLKSTSKHFSAGNDLADFLETPFNLESNVVQFLLKMAAMKKPVIAAVEGAAVGIGLTMLLHCDMVFIGEKVKMSVPFMKLGLTPEGGASELLAKRCSDLKANEWLMTGRTIFAEEAVSTGLANQSFASIEGLNEHVDALAQKMAKNSLEILLKTKALLKGEDVESTLALIKKEAVIFGQQLKTEAAQAAFAAFLNR